MVAFLLIALLLLWRMHGGLLLACAMWVLAFLYMRRLPPRLKGLPVAWLAVLFGMFCNAIVTVANGGFMPVKGLPSGFRPLFPTWIPARPANYLVILADQHDLFYFSVGDVLIISGALLWFVGPRLLRSFTQWRMRRANISHAQEIAQADPMSPCPSQTVPT
jgi:hypothetical protein